MFDVPVASSFVYISVCPPEVLDDSEATDCANISAVV